MKLWDTETGQCLKRFSNGKIPYVVRFHPDEDKQHIFLAGMSDKKIIQVRFARCLHYFTLQIW
jgi:pre-mRNA-processing factor 17